MFLAAGLFAQQKPDSTTYKQLLSEAGKITVQYQEIMRNIEQNEKIVQSQKANALDMIRQIMSYEAAIQQEKKKLDEANKEK
jgi:vacuolar-type H+-ATPase subunit I/STV1